MVPFSVIVPACNEAAVIGRGLTAIYEGAAPGAEPEVIVVCNGCRDHTAAVAREVAPRAIVIELEEGSKPAALNAGNEIATVFPRFFVDADVVVSYRALDAAAAHLRKRDIMVVAPGLIVDLEGCSAAVRAYYRVWQERAYHLNGVGGSGVYGLSQAALRELGSFPPIIADDNYIRTLFQARSRRVLVDDGGHPVASTIFPPRTALELIKVESRRRAGDAQVKALLGLQRLQHRERRYGDPLPRSGRYEDVLAYASIKLAGRGLYFWKRLCGGATRWERDHSSRIDGGKEAQPAGRSGG